METDPLQHLEQDRILGDFAAFCARAGISQREAGRQLMGDGKLIDRIRNGSLTYRTGNRLREEMRRYEIENPEPAGAAVPSDAPAEATAAAGL